MLKSRALSISKKEMAKVNLSNLAGQQPFSKHCYFDLLMDRGGCLNGGERDMLRSCWNFYFFKCNILMLSWGYFCAHKSLQDHRCVGSKNIIIITAQEGKRDKFLSHWPVQAKPKSQNLSPGFHLLSTCRRLDKSLLFVCPVYQVLKTPP